MPNNPFVIGADIGGTHITAALVDLEKRAVVPGSVSREKVDAHASCDGIMEVWSRAIRMAGHTPEQKLGLAVPGPFEYEKGVCLIRDQAKYDHLYGLNIKELLSEKLGTRPGDILLINDAAAFLEGEVFCGAAKGVEKAIGITLGTGLGTCLYDGHSSSSLDLWNLPFREGIAEDYLSTRWFTGRYAELTGTAVSGVQELAGLAVTDPQVQAVFLEFGRNLADFLAEFITIAPAAAVIIGGNIARSFHCFREPLLEKFTGRFPGTQVLTALLGEEAALLGAAGCWTHHETTMQHSALENRV